MKKIVALGLVALALFASTSPALAAIRIDGNNFRSAVVSRDADARLRILNETLYPDTVVSASDWLCDGMAPCLELPGSAKASETPSANALTIDYELVLRNDNRRII
ncbi:MAG: hypothetical protein E6H84_11080 [Chloroflexi bacterium]|nr:MAG: hypothetical protein E6H84_11080 [Chloroflexota bacterium]TMG70093.1 MAG: hypothetical protein E6H81_08325 [Chloroflexota bacterium]